MSKVGGGEPRRKALAGETAITSKAVNAPASVQPSSKSVTRRAGPFSHSQAARSALPSRTIRMASVGSEKSPSRKARKKKSRYVQRGGGVCAVKRILRSKNKAR